MHGPERCDAPAYVCFHNSIGWQVTATAYRDEIRRIFATMFSMKHHVLPGNRPLVDAYLHNVWVEGAKIIESLQPAKAMLSQLEHRFNEYTLAEEERILKNLEGIRYNIDALDTVATVTGPGRFEKVSTILVAVQAI